MVRTRSTCFGQYVSSQILNIIDAIISRHVLSLPRSTANIEIVLTYEMPHCSHDHRIHNSSLLTTLTQNVDMKCSCEATRLVIQPGSLRSRYRSSTSGSAVRSFVGVMDGLLPTEQHMSDSTHGMRRSRNHQCSSEIEEVKSRFLRRRAMQWSCAQTCAAVAFMGLLSLAGGEWHVIAVRTCIHGFIISCRR